MPRRTNRRISHKAAGQSRPESGQPRDIERILPTRTPTTDPTIMTVTPLRNTAVRHQATLMATTGQIYCPPPGKTHWPLTPCLLGVVWVWS